MLTILLSWIYISILCTLIGTGVLGFVRKTKFSWIHYIMAGITAITVYVEFFSIFARIGALAHGIMLLAALSAGYFRRKELGRLLKEGRAAACSWEGFFYFCFIFLIAFFYVEGGISHRYEHLPCGGHPSV